MKRLRRPKLKDGELRMYWGRLPYESPDVIYAWQGDCSMTGDSRLLYYTLSCQQPDTSVMPLFSKMKPSLIQELVSRGYDITTLKFSIMKKRSLKVLDLAEPVGYTAIHAGVAASL